MYYALLLALALSVDTFVLAISLGLSFKETINFSPYRYCLIFGVVQAGLFSIGRIFATHIPEKLLFSNINLHISSIVFAVLAIKMLLEFFGEEQIENNFNIHDVWKIAVLTSIDALIVGATPLNTEATNILLFFCIFIATTIAAFTGIELARNLKKVNIIEHYSLLIGSILLAILAIVSF
ncbi:manganese efflux pump [Mollicutes bacterium LVI A0039]|nr:manganese efflux pump [Mollicutes bacterium LVI A0039]